MLLAHNSMPLWLLEFCLSTFVVSCSSLSEDSAEFRYVPLYISDQVEFPKFCCSFTKTSHYSTLNSHMKTINSFVITLTKKNLLDMFGYSSVSGLQSFPPLVMHLRGFRQGLHDRKVKKIKPNWVSPKL